MVDQLLLHDLFYTNITFIDIPDIHNLSVQMFFQFLTFQAHDTYLVSHISYYKPQDKELCDPDICVIIYQYLKTASGVHLPEHITCYRQYCRKCCLLLPIYNCK